MPRLTLIYGSLLTLALLTCVPLEARAIPACEGAPDWVTGGPAAVPGSPIEVNAAGGLLCGRAGASRPLLREVQILEHIEVEPDGEVEAGAWHLVEYKDGSLATWLPIATSDWRHPRHEAKRIESIHPMYLHPDPLEVSASEEAFCWRLPPLKAGGTYLAVYNSGGYDPGSLDRGVVRLEAIEASLSAPQPPALEAMKGEDLGNACSDHGYFVPVFGPPGSSPVGEPIWAYDWEVRDAESGVVVQRGLDAAPYVFAEEREDAFQVSERVSSPENTRARGLEPGQRVYQEGRRYEFVARAVDWRGQRSEASRATFVFEETGSGAGWDWLVFYVMAGALLLVLLVIPAGALAVLVRWLLGRRRGGGRSIGAGDDTTSA